MKRLIIAAVAVLAFATAARADQYVNGYYRQNGTYVNPYVRSTPDGNPFNNFSTQGNVNPYTGSIGTHNPYATPSYSAPSYGIPSYGTYTNPYGMR